jgi:hypothetical protein
MTCCPTCGRKTVNRVSPTRETLPERAALDAAFAARQITKDQYFAECKRIGLRDDLRFFIRVTGADLPSALAVEAAALLEQLEQRAGKPADAKQINSLRDRYRVSRGSLIVRRAAAVAEAA